MQPDFLVKEKILSLVDAWQYAFSGSGNHPHYFAAYQELLVHIFTSIRLLRFVSFMTSNRVGVLLTLFYTVL